MVCLLALSACASQNVVDMGAGRHSVTGTSTKGLPAARADAVKQANSYCARSARRAVVESTDNERLAGVLSDPSINVVFRCGPPATTAFSR
jgi:hypothetical protein